MKRTAHCVYVIGIADIHAGAVKLLKAMKYLRSWASGCQSECCCGRHIAEHAVFRP